MRQHSLTVPCVTRPGQVLCLVAQPHDNWERMVQLLTSIPGGNLAKVVPLDAGSQIPPIYDSMVRKRDVDYLLTIGEVPVDLVTEVMEWHSLPQQCVVAESSRLVEEWRQGKVLPTRGLGMNSYDLIYHIMKKGPSALPIPMAAVTGVVPDVRGTQVVLERDDNAPLARGFALDRILLFHRQNRTDDDLEVPILGIGNLQHDDLYVIVGSGDDVADLFLYWNVRRVPVVRRHGVWLPRHLFSERNLKPTLETLHGWILRKDVPTLNMGGPVPWRPDFVKFVDSSRGICERIDELAVEGWQWGTAGPLDGEVVHFTPQPLEMLLDATGVKYGQLDAVQALVDGGQWSLLLAPYPEPFGAGAVSEISHRSLADMPSRALLTPSQHGVRSFHDGVVVYRNPNSVGRPEVVSLSLPSPWEVIAHVLGPSITPSEKAPPVVALVSQVGGIEKCDFLEDQRVLDFLEGVAMESVHRELKSEIMKIIDAVRAGSEAEEQVDALVRKIGDDIRSRRKLWRAQNDLDRRGISKELLNWLYNRDLFVAGIKLRCPECKGEGYYPPHLLADFCCSACGWTGKVPLVGSQTSVFYSPRDLLLSVTATGGLPVLLTLLRIHREHPTARTYPGVKLASAEGPREVDIVAWYGGQLFFYEVKHSGRHVHDALRLAKLCREYGAIPVFTAYEETRQVASHLRAHGVNDFRHSDLGKPVERHVDPWNRRPAWEVGD